MKNKKLMALMILSGLAVISLVYGLSAPTKGRGALRSGRRTTVETEGVETVSVDRNIMEVRRMAKRTEYTEWVRDPFTNREIGWENRQGLILNGIMWDSTEPKAIINNEILGVGDEIGGKTVIGIEEDYVVLNDGTNDFRLTLR